ncbi:MAG: PfkB family carbohydrate kinase [Paracoccaceae bacterium]
MTAPLILTVGSLHYDIMVEADHLPARDETAVGSRWYPKFGGKGGNQAVSVARQGGRSRLFGAVGDDAFGAFLRDGLRAAGVEDGFVVTVPSVGSGMSVAIQDAEGDYAATIVSGANLAMDASTLADDVLWEGVSLLVLQNEVLEGVNLAAAAEARRRGVRTILNAAPARTLPSALPPLIDVLVVNAVEAEMIGAGEVRDLDSAAAAASNLAGWFASVVVTAGSLGLAAHSADTHFVLAAEKVSVVSTHGAGDAFIGALACALANGGNLATACRAASHAAALHVSGYWGGR